MRYLVLVLFLLLTGCANNPDSIIDQLRLEEGETGSVCVRGSFDASSNPFVTILVTFVYRETSPDAEPVEC